MLKNESSFRLYSIALLGILFISTAALAGKNKKEEPKNVFSHIQDIEDADRINNGEMHVLNLTSIGERVEIIMPPKIQK